MNETAPEVSGWPMGRSRKGRQRAATTAYLQTVDRYLRIVQLLGLERRSKQLPNPADWLEGKA